MQCIVSDTAGLRDMKEYPSEPTGGLLVGHSGQSMDTRTVLGIDEVELEGMRRARQTFNSAHVR